MGIHISLILDNNYHIEIEKCMLLVPSVEQKLMSLVKGDTVYFEEDAPDWNTPQNVIHVLYLRSKKSVIIDDAVLNDCEDRGEATSLILVVILIAIVMVRFSINRINKK